MENKELWINGKMTDVTLEEACLKLIDVKAFVERYVSPHKKLTDAINIGIEAIKRVQKAQEPTTKNDLGVDCISRADARSLICDIDLKHHTFGMSRKVFKDLYNGIDDLPSVTPQEPKTGRWIDNKCTNCGYEVQPWNTTNYCPNCGAFCGGDNNG